MATNFLEAAGTNGFITAPFNLMTTELGNGSGLASGSAATSSVGGTSGVFTQSTIGQAIWGSLYFTSGGTFTPAAGGNISGWFLLSPDGGSSFETAVSTASTSVPALSRAPDFIIAFDNAAFATGNIRWCQGRYIQMPWESYKVLVQNNTGVTLPASGNTIKVGGTAIQY